MNSSDDKNALALEYVLGTLRNEERDAFEQQLATDDHLQQEVRRWEVALMPPPHSVPVLEPKADTLKKIQAAINQEEANPALSIWEKILPWKVITGIAFAMLVVVSSLFVNNALFQPSGLNTDYVAVLVDDEDQPILTALTASEGNTLWLKWENWQAPQEHSLQLWAKSRRDGQIRPLLVFNKTELTEVKLDQATLRLIQDSSHLIITQEEVGGSALDEPSDRVIAKGVCIRLRETQDSV
ncbi:anti-sigma factor [Oceaniserpentilla sp. 4NH20-0058]|uniref:anti-sigma factor n=1 Tax=Oceaniserpentilla sp. 4NH20-0058 TaxID=3127660 RepID=UPI003104E384